ncbi:MAG TPA: pyridine nucleotide-disulfide oxidoreductase, partial [Moraxellaceae bacterium]
MQWRVGLAALLLVTGLLLFMLWQQGWLSLAGLQQHHGMLLAWSGQWPLAARGGFFLFFVAATALSIPVATVLTLLAGSLFGFWEALLLVSFASCSGATLAMLLSRYFLRAQVERR